MAGALWRVRPIDGFESHHFPPQPHDTRGTDPYHIFVANMLSQRVLWGQIQPIMRAISASRGRKPVIPFSAYPIAVTP